MIAFLTSRLGIALIVVSLALGGFGWHKHVVHQRDAAVKSSGLWQAAYGSEKRAYDTVREHRAVEWQNAKDDAAGYKRLCDRRVAEARRSSYAIRTIVEKPRALDQNHCPIPELVSAGELRSALQGSARR